MFVDLGGEDVDVLQLPADGDWSDATERASIRTIAPLEPFLPDGSDQATAGWRLYLPAGDPITRADRVRVRGQVYSVQGQPELWPDTCVVVTVVAPSRSARISLRTPATSSWSDEDEKTTTTPAATYASNVPAGIQAQVNRSNNDAVAGEETLTEQPYVVTIDQDLAPADGDQVLVTGCPEDLSLVNRTLLVHHVVRGTERFERQLLCTLIDDPAT